MKILIDTQVLILTLHSPEKLSNEFLEAIENPENYLIVSAASIWEMRIKESIGKLKVKKDLVSAVRSQGFEFLNVTPEHTDAIKGLPKIHKDPFDRLLVAQAKYESFSLMTLDAEMMKYPVEIYRQSIE